MVLKSEKVRLKKMLSDSITVLCRAGLPFQSKFEIEALIGITLDDNEVVLVNIKETLLTDSLTVPLDGEDSGDEEVENIIEDGKNDVLCNDDEQQTNVSAAKLEDNQLHQHTVTNGNRLKNSNSRKFRNFEESQRMPVKSSSSRKSHEQWIKSEDGIEQRDFDCNSDERNFASVDYDQTFIDDGHSGFRAQIKIEDRNADDCMIMKTEHPNFTETYELDNDQPWNEHSSEFDGSAYMHWQTAEVSDDKPFTQETNWFSQPSQQSDRKLKLPFQQRRKGWMTGPSCSYAKTKYLEQHTTKLHTKSESVSNQASDSAIASNVIGRPVMQCAYCNAVFNKSHVLKEHVNGVHFKKKLFHCPDCGESFKWRAELSRHRRVPGLCPCRDAGSQDWPDQF